MGPAGFEPATPRFVLSSRPPARAVSTLLMTLKASPGTLSPIDDQTACSSGALAEEGASDDPASSPLARLSYGPM